MQSVMVVECAWCREIMGTKDGQGETGTTSAICERCVDEHFPELAVQWHQRRAGFIPLREVA